MGSYWSSEELGDIKPKEIEKKDDKNDDKPLLKKEITSCDIVQELKNNPLFNEHRNRSQSKD